MLKDTPIDTDPFRGKYHPLNSEFAVIKDANTECAEQSFKWLNYFLRAMVNLHNTYREQQLAGKDTSETQPDSVLDYVYCIIIL